MDGWILISKAMPKDDGDLILHISEDGCEANEVGYYIVEDGCFYDNMDHKVEGVVAWARIEPFKEEHK